MLKAIVDKLFRLEEWQIGVVRDSHFTDADFYQKVRWYNFAGYSFEADPFLFELDGLPYLAFEVYSYLVGQGKLKCFDLAGKEYDFFSDINTQNGHVSFPYMFEYQSELYLIPETSDQKVIKLYRFETENQKFTYVRDLLSGHEYVDSVLYPHQDGCYLFTSSNEAPTKQRLYRADELTSTFLEHPQSPIADSPQSGRNGGAILQHNSQLFRVAQTSEGSVYGRSILLMRIESLSRDEYREREWQELTPSAPFPDGLHTLNQCNGTWVIDAKRYSYAPTNIIIKLAHKLVPFFRPSTRYPLRYAQRKLPDDI